MKIIHNLLEPSVFKEIQTIVFSNDFPLYYQSEVGKIGDKSDFYFSHLFYV
jgi:hypothetical protein